MIKRIYARSAILLLLAFAVMLTYTPAESHPAKSIAAKYNQDGSLSVEVVHPVNDPAKHYINRISVYKNGALIAQESYETQDSETDHSRTFQIGQCAPGTRIMVEADCSIMGTLHFEITI